MGAKDAAGSAIAAAKFAVGIINRAMACSSALLNCHGPRHLEAERSQQRRRRICDDENSDDQRR
jgi:hypothetical protein